MRSWGSGHAPDGDSVCDAPWQAPVLMHAAQSGGAGHRAGEDDRNCRRGVGVLGGYIGPHTPYGLPLEEWTLSMHSSDLRIRYA